MRDFPLGVRGLDDAESLLRDPEVGSCLVTCGLHKACGQALGKCV